MICITLITLFGWQTRHNGREYKIPFDNTRMWNVVCQLLYIRDISGFIWSTKTGILREEEPIRKGILMIQAHQWDLGYPHSGIVIDPIIHLADAPALCEALSERIQLSDQLLFPLQGCLDYTIPSPSLAQSTTYS